MTIYDIAVSLNSHGYSVWSVIQRDLKLRDAQNASKLEFQIRSFGITTCGRFENSLVRKSLKGECALRVGGESKLTELPVQ